MRVAAHAFRPDEARVDLASWRAEQPAQLSGESLPRAQVVGERRRDSPAGDVPSPEIADRLQAQRLVVVQQLELERQPGGKRGIRQRALTEAVNGEYRGFVEGVQRRVEAARICSRSTPAFSRRQRPDGRRKGHSQRAALQKAEDIDDPAADTLAQFGGGGIGEGDHQDLWTVEIRLRAAGAGRGHRCSRSCRCRPTPRSDAGRRVGRRRRRGRSLRLAGRGGVFIGGNPRDSRAADRRWCWRSVRKRIKRIGEAAQRQLVSGIGGLAPGRIAAVGPALAGGGETVPPMYAQALFGKKCSGADRPRR
jgi:hypothetical protein